MTAASASSERLAERASRFRMLRFGFFAMALNFRSDGAI
jgi:hypothetical protein